MFAVVLDTCVLWPSRQRDFLLSLAVEGLYRPLWSDQILDELETHEALKLIGRGTEVGVARTRARRLIETMASAFDDALVENWQPHEGAFGLPDPNDEHVLAAAVVGGAGAVVTDNVRDFPKDRVPKNIQILEPQQFAADTVSVSPQIALQAVKTMAARLHNPPMTVEQVLEVLVNCYGMSEAVDLLCAV